MQSARFICPVVGLEMNGRHRSVFMFLDFGFRSKCCAKLNREQLKMFESIMLQIMPLPKCYLSGEYLSTCQKEGV